MVLVCAVATCRATGKGVSLFSFPDESNPVYKDWVAFCRDSHGPDDPEFVVRPSSRVCEAHFEFERYNYRVIVGSSQQRLKRHAKPTCYTPHRKAGNTQKETAVASKRKNKDDSNQQQTASAPKVPKIEVGDADGVSARKLPVRMSSRSPAVPGTHFVDVGRPIGVVNKLPVRDPIATTPSVVSRPPPIAVKVLSNESVVVVGGLAALNPQLHTRTTSQTPMKLPVRRFTVTGGQTAVNSQSKTQMLQISPVKLPVRLPTVKMTASGKRVVVEGSNLTQPIHRTADAKKLPASEIVLEDDVEEFEQCLAPLASPKKNTEVVQKRRAMSSNTPVRLPAAKPTTKTVGNPRVTRSTVGEYMHIDDFLDKCKLEPFMDPLALNSSTVAAPTQPTSQPSMEPSRKKKQMVIIRTYKPSAPTPTPPVSMHNQILHTLETNSFERERIRLLQVQSALLRSTQRSAEGFRRQLLEHEREMLRKTEAHRQEILANRKEVLALKRRKLEFLMRQRAKKQAGDDDG